MIFYTQAWDSKKNIGHYYNAFMFNVTNPEDWVCFTDSDACFTTYNYGKQLEDIITKHPDVGCFTARTNRVNCIYQVANGIDHASNDMTYHRELGKVFHDTFYDECVDVTKAQLFSGFCILIKKELWDKFGGVTTQGMLGVDNEIHVKIQKNNEKVFLMKGVYLYHWYSNFHGKGKRDISHLK